MGLKHAFTTQESLENATEQSSKNCRWHYRERFIEMWLV